MPVMRYGLASWVSSNSAIAIIPLSNVPYPIVRQPLQAGRKVLPVMAVMPRAGANLEGKLCPLLLAILRALLVLM